MASSVFSILLPLSVLCRLLIPRHARVGVSGISVLSYRYTFFKNGSYHCLSVKPQAVRNFTRFLLPPVFKNFFKTILICSSVLLSTFCVVQPSPQSSFKVLPLHHPQNSLYPFCPYAVNHSSHPRPPVTCLLSLHDCLF